MSEAPRGQHVLNLPDWLAILRSRPELAAVTISPDEERAVLDLTRVAAHRSERVAAPITAFVCGLALSGRPPTERAALLRALAAALEVEDAD